MLNSLSSAPAVPATSQITFSKAISSTSIKFEWSSVIGADSYILFTFTTLGGQVDGLTPSTTYNCYLYSSNSAGRGAKSSIKTIMTLTVTDSDHSNGPVIRNTSTTSMDISNLEPCSTYTVGVSSVNVFLVPGEPYNVLHKTSSETGAECHSDMLITTWDSALGALSYIVEAQGNTGQIYNCTSSSNSCAVTGVPCGEHLSVWITASNDKCTTNRVLGEVAQTDSARLNWTSSIGVIFYIAVAEDANGNTHSCNSMGTNCLIEGLRCGQNYTASIIGTNLKCNSSASGEVTFMTAPCPPTNIEAFRDCDANHALIVWQNHQPTGLYTATIEEQSGAQLTCTSNTVNNCKIISLPCGKRYNVTVTYSDGNCPSTSTLIKMDSVPCGPENVSASVACVTGELTVTWDISVPAENYTTIISRGMGQPLHCNSSEMQCTMGGLVCGSSYMVVVLSVTGTCFSLPSTEVTVQALPCPPTNVTTVHTCAPDPVPVAWTPSDSAKFYTAVAVSGRGHSSECTTNQTSCSLPGLQCGEVYTVGVSGADDNSPCSPRGLRATTGCGTNSLQAFWNTSLGATSYTATVTGPNGFSKTCSTSDLTCSVSGLLCASQYNVRVTSRDKHCTSSPTQVVMTTGCVYTDFMQFRSVVLDWKICRDTYPLSTSHARAV
uniref:Fibronectin type-III domain-containing protein n=1 Tax=Mola mola TaxID=94237 RepID=A0A3Q3WDV2_MOLML